MTRMVRILVPFLLTAGFAQGAVALTFAGSDGSGRQAQVDFTIQNTDQMLVTLSNTSMSDVLVPTDVLTAVYFDLRVNGAAPTTVKALSARVTGAADPMSQVVKWNATTKTFVAAPTMTDLDGEWALAGNLDWATVDKEKAAGDTNKYSTYGKFGISSTGLGLFGNANFGDFLPNLAGPGAPNATPDYTTPGPVDGVQGGILSKGDILKTVDATGGLTSKNQQLFEKYMVNFVLDNLPVGTVNVSNVRFQYGTGLTEPAFAGTAPPSNGGGGGGVGKVVPEPGTLVLLGTGLIGLAGVGRRKLGRKAPGDQ